MTPTHGATVPAVVFKTAEGVFHHGGLGIVRSLGRLGVPVYVYERKPWAPIVWSRYARGRLGPAPDGASTAQVVAHLMDLGAKLGNRPLLIPTGDAETMLVAEHADTLAERFRFPRQSARLIHQLASKQEMYVLCKQYGIPTPETSFPACRADVLRFLKTATFPVVLKAIDARVLRHRPGAKSVTITHTPAELLGYYDAWEVPGQANLMLQEYIPGGPDSVWMFNGYFNEQSACLVGFTGQKLRQHPPYSGMTSLGVCRPNETVFQTTVDLMRHVGYQGILDIGYRFDARDGQYKLLDVNPRIGATFRLFVGDNGMDVARALYLDLTGQTVPATHAVPGRKWLVENFDPLSSLVYFRDHRLTVGEWARSFAGVREGAWFAADDPAPFLAMCGGFTLKGARVLCRQWAHALPGARARPAGQSSDMGLGPETHTMVSGGPCPPHTTVGQPVAAAARGGRDLS